jgi:hypothetical protein
MIYAEQLFLGYVYLLVSHPFYYKINNLIYEGRLYDDILAHLDLFITSIILVEFIFPSKQ